ncbi:MAG: helix-turn-helix domain-containing protein [Acidimicrobiaceae bacterium]|nr:helix-turn-helix domain-containing protein [Acidimicrobiaceae bacterium]
MRGRLSAVELTERTYLPEGAAIGEVYEFLEARKATTGSGVGSGYLLVGADTHEQVELPENLYRILLQVVEALKHGMAVAIAPLAQTLTTQQAADLLGISRPTLIRLLNAGRLPYERVGTHRRLRLRDVLRYREERRAEQYRFLDETAVPLDEEENPAEVIRSLRETRHRLAAERRRNV